MGQKKHGAVGEGPDSDAPVVDGGGEEDVPDLM